jgi:hypothetical protein
VCDYLLYLCGLYYRLNVVFRVFVYPLITQSIAQVFDEPDLHSFVHHCVLVNGKDINDTDGTETSGSVRN